MTSSATIPTHVIDVSRLPPTAFDARAPVWWGNLLFVLIETMGVAILAAAYFYLRQNFDSWPPPRVNDQPALFDPAPDLPAGTANVILLAASCIPMWIIDHGVRRGAKWVPLGLVGMGLVGVISMVLRGFEFPAMKFWWDDNAYGSLVWTILGFHLVYLIAATGEILVLAYWLVRYGIDEKHAVDVTLTGGYWYWTAGMWLPLYVILYWIPRFT
jgi:heme/copper-type cytochrome/quinol oxidase subunit 3